MSEDQKIWEEIMWIRSNSYRGILSDCGRNLGKGRYKIYDEVNALKRARDYDFKIINELKRLIEERKVNKNNVRKVNNNRRGVLVRRKVG